MALKASEISELIKQRIEDFDAKAEARDVGTVVALTDGIVRIHGLADVQYGEMIEFPGGSFGLALNLEQDSVGRRDPGRIQAHQRGRYGSNHGPDSRGAGG